MLSKNYGLVIFGCCLFLFQFANASMLPLVGEELAYRHATSAALIIVPQIVVTLNAPWGGERLKIGVADRYYC
jgi:hypothetical protein